MTTNRWRGDAASQPKILELVRPNNATSRIELSIGNKRLEFGKWNSSEIASSLNTSGFPELTGVSAVASAAGVTLTGPDDTDFDVTMSVRPSVEVEFTNGVNPVNQVTRLSFQNATGGSFKLRCNTQQTASIDLFSSGNINLSGIATAIGALTDFATTDVEVEADGDDVLITWVGDYAEKNVGVVIDGSGLNNGGAVVVKESAAARPAAKDVWFMGTLADYRIALTMTGVGTATFKTNETDAELSDKFSAAFGGRVEVYSEPVEAVHIADLGIPTVDNGVANDKARFYVLDMVGFRGIETTLTAPLTVPSGDDYTDYVLLQKVVDSTVTPLQELFLVDLREGGISAEYTLGKETEQNRNVRTGSGGFGFGGADFGGGAPPNTVSGDDWSPDTVVGKLQKLTRFTEWSPVINKVEGGLSHSTGGARMFGEKLYILPWSSDNLRLFNQLGGKDLPDDAIVVSDDSDGKIIKLQDGSTTNAASPATHSVYVAATDFEKEADVAGTFRLTFAEGETADLTVGALASAIETAVEAAVGFGVTVTGSGTTASPYEITYTEDLSERDLPFGSTLNITGDGRASSTVLVSRVVGLNAAATVRVSQTADGGSYALKYGDDFIPGFLHDDSAAEFLATLQSHSPLSGSGDVTVAFNAETGEYKLAFASGLAKQSLPTLSLGKNSLTDSNAANDTRIVVQRPTGPSDFSQPLNWSLSRVPWSGDEIILDESVGPITYGLRQFVEVTVDPATNTLTATGGTDFANGQQISFQFGSVAIGGLSESTNYFVTNLNQADGTFRVSATESGPSVSITSTGTGPHYAGVIASDVLVYASFTDSVGLPRRNDDGYDEYRNRFLKIGIAADGEIIIGDGDGSGSGMLHVDAGNSNGQITVLTTSLSQVLGIPALLVAANSDGLSLLIRGGEVGVAVYDDEVAKLGQFNALDGGFLTVGSATIVNNAIAAPGALKAKRMSVNGLVNMS